MVRPIPRYAIVVRTVLVVAPRAITVLYRDASIFFTYVQRRLNPEPSLFSVAGIQQPIHLSHRRPMHDRPKRQNVHKGCCPPPYTDAIG